MTAVAANVAALLVLPFVVLGVVQRTRSLWAARRGPPLTQAFHDLVRLLRKTPVRSEVTTPIFRLAPWVVLATTLAGAAVVPLTGSAAAVSFPFDFVWLAYVWGLGRLALMLGAMDTGSAFEGMGASREATFATVLEPGWFLVLGALVLVSGATTLSGLVGVGPGGAALLVRACAAAGLLIVAQAEGGRVPIDDPATHLELTMIHEVMVLDHSGPDLAALQVASAWKLLVLLSLDASLLAPTAGLDPGPAVLVHTAVVLGLAVVVGTLESVVARLALELVPRYLLLVSLCGGIALLATTWTGVGA